MKRSTALRFYLVIGIVLAICGVGFVVSHIVFDGEVDGFDVLIGAAMAAVGVVLIVVPRRRRVR